MNHAIYDFVAIGLGPFNLSLSCLSAPIDGLRCLFLEKQPEFNWHGGMMIDGSTLQNPFLADLVSLADPRSEFSYLNYCKQEGRLYSYYMRESHYLRRDEYNRYCRWAVARLPNLRFGCEVQSILYDHDDGLYLVSGINAAQGERFLLRCRKLVLGVGSLPTLPACCDTREAPYIHSADYLRQKPQLQRKSGITVVGSGQSAAEVFHDLLRDSDAHAYSLTWITRSPRFFQMETTKLTLELISPDYTDYMLSLSDAQRTQVLARQSSLYKGINASLINDIYDLLDHKISAGDQRYTLMTNAELEACRFDGARHEYMLDFRQVETGQPFRHATDGLVLATGYAPKLPACIHPIRERIVWGADGSYRLAPNYAADINGQEIFVQNGGIASHGITNPDLGFCCWRNSVILQAITGVEHYPIERSTALQDFAPPRSGVLKHRGQRPSMAGDARAPQISHAGLASQFAY